MKPLVLKQNPQPEPPKVSIDMAEQIADRAARRAADEAAVKAAQQVSNEAMDNFNKYQEQNRQTQQETYNQNYQNDVEDPGVDLFDKTTANSITKTVRAFKSMQEVFAPPPDPIRSAMENGISQMAAKFVESTLLGGSGTGIIAKKSSFIIDVMNTAAAHGFGESLGNNLPQVIQSLSGVIGQQKTQELVDNLNSKMAISKTEIIESGKDDSSNVEKQKDMVLALDVNNSEHIKQYASAMGLTQKAAKGMLQIHQDDILSERKILNPNTNSNPNSNLNPNVGNIELVQAIGTLIQEMTGMKNTINNLQSEISNIRSKKVDEDVTEPESADRKWTDEDEQINVSKPVSVTHKSVTLFSTPIKVDVDSIRGDTNSFFKESSDDKVEKQKESILEEIIDSEGKSTFKMSDEKEQPKKMIEPSKERPKKVIEKPIEIEEDKKKESNSSELVKEVENELPQNDEITNVEKINIEKSVVRKKIIRKPVPIINDILSHVTEKYDINNNLIIENKNSEEI